MKSVVSGMCLLASLALAALGPVAQTARAQEAPSVLMDFSFISPVFSGFDDYYSDFVLAYKMGSKAKVAVFVLNSPFGRPAEISGVGIWFDWMPFASSVKSDECTKANPCILAPGTLSSYKITFDVPSSPPELNELPHIFEVRVFAVVEGREVLAARSLKFGLATYSPDQTDAQELIRKLRFFFAFFRSAEANAFFTGALLELEAGREHYRKGEFSLAKSRLTSALSLLNKAINTEAVIGKGLDDAVISQARAAQLQAEASRTRADASKAQADAAKAQAEASRIQADASKKMADAAVTQADAAQRQVEAAKLEVEAQRAVASSLLAQADAFRLQAESSRIQAWGLTIGTIVIGIALLAWVVRRPRT